MARKPKRSHRACQLYFQMFSYQNEFGHNKSFFSTSHANKSTKHYNLMKTDLSIQTIYRTISWKSCEPLNTHNSDLRFLNNHYYTQYSNITSGYHGIWILTLKCKWKHVYVTRQCKSLRIFNNYPAKSRGISSDTFSRRGRNSLTFLNLSVDIFSLHFFFPRTKLRIPPDICYLRMTDIESIMTIFG